jgi:circadian clock protein KaiC
MAVDPVSAMAKAGGSLAAQSMADRLLSLTRSAGITLFCTSLVGGGAPEAEATDLQISTIADTWIHLSYIINAGERNRALSIVKSRGTGHSRQVRELVLSDEGISLADVYASGGEVLMGTMRWEREDAARTQRVQARADLERRSREMELTWAEAQARMEAIKRELETIQAESLRLQTERDAFEADWQDRRDEVRALRGADAAPSSADTDLEEQAADQQSKQEGA